MLLRECSAEMFGLLSFSLPVWAVTPVMGAWSQVGFSHSGFRHRLFPQQVLWLHSERAWSSVHLQFCGLSPYVAGLATSPENGGNLFDDMACIPAPLLLWQKGHSPFSPRCTETGYGLAWDFLRHAWPTYHPPPPSNHWHQLDTAPILLTVL